MSPSFTTELRFVDKTEWPRGPWDGEPDKAVWVDEATGLDCMVRRGPVGSLCGYAGVALDHPLHGEDCDALDMDVNGGLTYAAGCQDSDEPSAICHTPQPGRPDDVWWFGFDCAHAYDFSPVVAMTMQGLGIETTMGNHYWTFGEVIREVERLARQLHAAQGAEET